MDYKQPSRGDASFTGNARPNFSAEYSVYDEAEKRVYYVLYTRAESGRPTWALFGYT